MFVEESKRNTLKRSERDSTNQATTRKFSVAGSTRFSTAGPINNNYSRERAFSIVGAKQILNRRTSTLVNNNNNNNFQRKNSIFNNNNNSNNNGNSYSNVGISEVTKNNNNDKTDQQKSRVARKYDIYLYTALTINVFLLIIIIMDIYKFTQIRTKRPPDPINNNNNTNSTTIIQNSTSTSTTIIQNSVDDINSIIEELNIKMRQVSETVLRSPPVRRYIFLLQYIANYTSLLSFIFNILHHPYHRRLRSKALMFFSIFIFVIRVIWESFVERYTPLITQCHYCHDEVDCEEDYYDTD